VVRAHGAVLPTLSPTALRIDDLPFALPPELIGRSTIARKARRIDAECIVRGYLSGSAWVEYEVGSVNGVRMPKGMQEATFPSRCSRRRRRPKRATTNRLLRPDAGGRTEAAQVLRLRRSRCTTTRRRMPWSAHHHRRPSLRLGEEPIVVDEILTPDSSRFGRSPTTRPDSRRRVSTSSTCAIGSRARAGTGRRRGRELPPDRSKARTASEAYRLPRVRKVR
jgi:phosphoribosylaminoimidazole-succinocarboxamide synthase